jgi:hypothetical protein
MGLKTSLAAKEKWCQMCVLTAYLPTIKANANLADHTVHLLYHALFLSFATGLGLPLPVIQQTKITRFIHMCSLAKTFSKKMYRI